MPQVIFLNGASCAGKTSLGKALQAALPDPYLLLGLDTLFAMVPPDWAGGPPGRYAHDGFAYTGLPTDNGQPMLSITYGDIGWQMMTGFHRAVAELVRSGNRVIIDEMLLAEQVGEHWKATLAPFQPLTVGVRCDLDELETREQARGNRPGLARWSARQAHLRMSYDIVLDTTDLSPPDCAEQVIASLPR